MKHVASFSFLALALILFTTAPVDAQQRADGERPNVTFQLGGGATVPLSPSELTDVADTGFNLTGAAGISVTQELEVVLSVTYNELAADFDPDGTLPPDADVDSDFTILSGEVNLKYNLPLEASFTPYLTAGGGIYNREATLSVSVPGVGEVSESESETDVGINIGAGLAFPLANNVGFFVEPRYTVVFTEEDNAQYLPIRAGITVAI